MGNARWRGVPLKAVLDMAGVQEGAKQVTFNGMDGPVSDKTPDFVKALDIDHARDGEVMLAYGMNGDDLPLLNGFPLRLVVPGYYGTYWVKHLNEITVIDNVFDGFWMKSAYRIPDTPNNCVEPGTAPKATIPINRFTVRSFITNVADGAKLKPGSTTLKGIAFDGGKGIKEVAVSTDGGKTWTPAKLGKDLGKYSFREWKLPVKLAAGSHELKVRATNNAGDTQPMDAVVESGRLSAQRRRNRPRHRGVRRMIMKRPASPRARGHRRPRRRRGLRRAGQLHAPGRDRRVQARPQSRRGAEQLHRLPLRRLHQDPAARREIQEGFLAGRSDQDDQGLRRADRRAGCPQDRRLSCRDVLRSAARTPLNPPACGPLAGG